MTEVIIFTDGAAKGNPGPGGWGAIVASDSEVAELGGREDHTTNNRMELRAAFEALSFAKKFEAADVVLYTDSSYVINGATLWGVAWIKRGWITKDKRPVLNRDMWEPFLSLVDTYAGRIEWKNVGGHVGVAGNERADTIASRFALREFVDLFAGSRSAYNINVADVSFDEEKQKMRTESRARAKQKAYSYVSVVDGDTRVHKTWKECEARVRGRKARFKKAFSAAEEADIIQRFNI
ncbi:MAG TPA: ribonuclease H [Candidatus Paceibacterota bacterium]